MLFKLHVEYPNYLNIEKDLGEYVELELEKLGFEITLSTGADWGYVFRIKHCYHLYDIIIRPMSVNNLSISINPVPALLDKIFCRTSIGDIQELENILTTIIKSHSSKPCPE